MLFAVVLLIQDPDALVADLSKDDEPARQKAVEAIGKLDEKARRALAPKLLKPAQEAARTLDAEKQKALAQILAKRPDEKALKKRTQEVRAIWEKIPFPETDDGRKLQGELRVKLEALWREQYPDLGGILETEAARPAAAKLASVAQAAEKCGDEKTTAAVKKLQASAAIDEHEQWRVLLPAPAVATLTQNEEIFKKAKGDQSMQECEYRCSITLNEFRVLFGVNALRLDPALSRECRKWSAFIDGGGKGGAYGVHSDTPNEDMGQGGPQGDIAAWTIMASDREHIGAVFKWGCLGIGYHGRWWTWRG